MPLALLTVEGDIHAHALAWGLSRIGVKTAIVQLNSPGGAPDRLGFDPARPPLAEALPDGGAVFFRRGATGVALLDAEPELTTLDQSNREETFNRFLRDFENSLGLFYDVINDPAAARAASMKLRHMAAASGAGFRVPETIVTADPEQVEAFVTRVGGDAVYKPYRHNIWRTGDREFAVARTRAFGSDDLHAFAAAPRMPAIIQARIDKRAEFRICVFGDTVLGAHQVWCSDQLDWRAGVTRGATLKLASLPPGVAESARILTQRLGVEVATLDLAEDEEGTLWFLDFNPNGQFLYLEEHVDGLSLLAAAVDFLATRCGTQPTVSELNRISWARFKTEIPDEVRAECEAARAFVPRYVRKAVPLITHDAHRLKEFGHDDTP